MSNRPSVTPLDTNLTPEKVAKQTEEGMALARKLERFLKGKHPSVSAVCLAELVSMWACGHIVLGDPAATKTIRTLALQGWSEMMLNLVPANAKILDAEAEAMGLSEKGKG